MARLKRIARWAGIALAAFIALVGIAAVAGYAVLNSDAGRTWAIAKTRDLAAGAGLQLEVSGLSGRLPFSIEIERLSLADDEGEWLNGENLYLAWKPGALLAGSLEISEISASAVEVRRAPLTADTAEAPVQDSAEETALTLPSLETPLPVRIERLAIERLALGEALLGQAAAFRLSGAAAAATTGGVTSRLELRRIDDAPETKLTANAVLDSTTGNLDLDARLTEAPGGLIGNLADLPDQPSIDISLNGQGALTSWPGRIEARIGEARGAFDLQLNEGRQISMEGALSPGPFVPQDLQPLLRGGLKFALRGERAKDGALRLERLEIGSEAARLKGEGRLDPVSGALSLDAEIDLKDDGALDRLIAPTRLEASRARVTLRGNLDKPRFEAKLSMKALSSAGLRGREIELQASAEGARGLASLAEDARFSLQVTAGGVDGLDSLVNGAEALLGGPVSLSTEGTLSEGTRLDLSALSVTLPKARIEGAAQADLAAGNASAELDIDLPELAALQRLTSLALQGGGTLQTRLDLPAFDGRLNASFTGTLRDAGIGIDLADALLSPTTELTGELQLAADGGLTLPSLVFDGPRARIAAQVAIPGSYETLEVQSSLKAPDAGILSEALGVSLSGALQADALLAGPLGDPGVEGTATLERITLATGGEGGESPDQDADAAEAMALNDLRARFDLKSLASGARGPVSARAESPYGPVSIATGLTVGEERISFDAIQASALNLEIGGALSMPLQGPPIAGELQVASGSLTAALAAAGLEGDGAADVAIRLLDSGGRQGLRASGSINSFGLSDSVSARQLRLDLRAENLLETPEFQAGVTGEEIEVPAASLKAERLSLSAGGGAESIALDFSAEGEASGPFDLTGRGTLRPGTKTTFELSALSGQLLGEAIDLRAPLTLTTASDGVAIEGLDLAFAGGGISGDLSRRGDAVDARLQLRELPLSLSRLASPPIAIGGRVNGTVTLSGEGRRPRADLQLDFTGVELGDIEELSGIEARVTGGLNEGRLTLEARASGPWKTPLEAKADLPLTANLAEGLFDLPGDGRLSASVDWAGDVAPLMVLLPQDEHLLEGDAEIEMRVEGTVAAPRLRGQIALAQGRYEHLIWGTLLKDIELAIRIDEEAAEVTRLTANDGNGGKVSGGGRFSLAGATGSADDGAVDFQLQLDKARLVRRDNLTATASGKIGVKGALAGPQAGLDVKGRITVDEAEARLASDLPPSVVELDVVETRNGEVIEPDSKPGPEDEAEGPLRVNLDIQIDMPRKIFIRGRGLDSEWRGNVHIGGTAADPVIEGQLNSVRGQMSLLGKTFLLDPSAVNFLRGPELDPELDISATHDGEELDVTVRLGGSAADPSLSLSSSPPVPEDEILSRTLFNKPASQLSALETVQLASAVGQLAGGGGAGVLDMARNLVGADVLRIDSAGADGGTTVEAGKYITEDVYLGVEQGATAGSGSVSVEVDLTPNIKLKSDLGAPESSNVGVQFEWDY